MPVSQEGSLRHVASHLLSCVACTICLVVSSLSYIGSSKMPMRSLHDPPAKRSSASRESENRQLYVEKMAPIPTAQSPGGSLGNRAMVFGSAIGLAASVASAARSGKRSVAMRFFGGGGRRNNTFLPCDDPWLTFADNGFDPLGLAVQPSMNFGDARTTYFNYRESEVKHGRFAMAAFLAIFGEESDRNALFNQLGVPGYETNVAATFELDQYQDEVLLFGLFIQLAAEITLAAGERDGNILSVEYNPSRVPGNLNFDPLNFKALGGGDIKPLHNSEVQLGRLAMVGITTFLLREYVIT